MKVSKIKSGNILYFEDTPAKSIYVIKSGKLYLRKAHDEYYFKNNELSSKIIMGPGDMFGFEEVFLGIKRIARAVAIDETELIIFDLSEFSDFLKKNVKIGKRVLTSLSHDIRETSNRIKKLSDENKSFSETSGTLYDIYLYFIKENELHTARQILNRMKVIEAERKFAEAEMPRLEKFLEFEIMEISPAAIKTAKDAYNGYPEILEYLLCGLKQSVMEDEVMEALLYEIIMLRKTANKLKRNHMELEEFVHNYPNSPHFKDMLFMLLEVYHVRKEFLKAYQISQSLSEEDLSDEEKDRFKEMVNFLRKVISKKGGGLNV